jgi:tetratricopeptide (TPR) repeat protein
VWAQQDSNPPADANPTPKLEAPPRYDTPSPEDEDQPGAIHAPAQPGKAPSTAQRSEDSSSRNTIIDLSPPAGDGQGHPHSDISAGNPDNTGVNEMRLWDPHRAEKNVEVGDYYFKQKNYQAAESRYREALMYKPDDAVATYRLAQALEKNGNLRFALQNYEHYLKILPHGSFAPDARKATARVQAELDK